MSSTTRPPAAPVAEKSYFEQQREALLKEIGIVRSPSPLSLTPFPKPRNANGRLINAQSFEHVLANINKLNRSMEGVIAVCFL